MLLKLIRKFFSPEKTICKDIKSSFKSFNVHPSSRINYNNVINKYGGIFSVGENTIVEGVIVFEKFATVKIGSRTFIGSSQILSAECVTIGDDVLISFGCIIVDHNSHAINFEQRKNDVLEWYNGRKDWVHVVQNPVTICNKSWVGMHAMILKGVTIGEGAVVGAGAVVTKDVAPYTVVAGNPARVVRVLTPPYLHP